RPVDYWVSADAQGIIQRGASELDSTGKLMCSAGIYLRRYAPFADLTTSDCGSCATVAKYTSTVLAASAYSTAAMLKAQMLATALSVFFYREIGAQLPIGSQNIDLTAICSTINYGNC